MYLVYGSNIGLGTRKCVLEEEEWIIGIEYKLLEWRSIRKGTSSWNSEHYINIWNAEEKNRDSGFSEWGSEGECGSVSGISH